MTNLATRTPDDDLPSALGLQPPKGWGSDWQNATNYDGNSGSIQPLDSGDDLSTEYVFTKAEMGSDFDVAIEPGNEFGQAFEDVFPDVCAKVDGCENGVCSLSENDLTFLDSLLDDFDV